MNKNKVIEVKANGLLFRGRAGNFENGAGEAVILLHGFPETSAMWEDLITVLCRHGYRCFAPDQRGYSPGARPAALSEYSYERLVSDLGALADSVGFERFHLIGHDWGSVVGWAALQLFPDRIQSWTAMSVPHISAFRLAIATDVDQQQRSRYLAFFMRADEPENWFLAKDCEALRSLWAPIPERQIEEYLRAFSEPGALTAALNWYRANAALLGTESIKFGPVGHPTLLLWGNADIAVGRKAVEDTAAYMRGPFKLVELDAGHWLVQEEPERVQQEILRHLRAHSYR